MSNDRVYACAHFLLDMVITEKTGDIEGYAAAYENYFMYPIEIREQAKAALAEMTAEIVKGGSQ